MPSLPILLAVSVTVGGALAVAVGLSRSRGAVTSVGRYLEELDDTTGVPDEFEQRLAEPFLLRAVRPLGAGFLNRVAGLTPRNYLASVHRKLQLAGLTGTMRAEEFVAVHAAVTAAFTVGAILYVFLGHPAPSKGIFMVVLLPAIGLLLPSVWLTRKVTERQDSIRRDLPDTLDLLAISVEAGMGFEGALDVVCQHFQSPLAGELALTLREMELGLPRRDAFQNLKHRTEVSELSNFVLAIMQADALGIPIGRVLRTQAVEMRNKRRQWAREKAGKLPVKILFPLVLFIFPAIFVIVLGPGVPSMLKALK